MPDPIALASITSAVAVLATEYLKGVATDAGKSTWLGIKSLLGWASDPAPAEIPEKVANALTASPETADKLLALLKAEHIGAASSLVGKIEASGGKIVVANTIVADHIQM